MKIHPKAKNAMDLSIDDLFSSLQKKQAVYVPKKKKNKAKTKKELDDLVNKTDLDRSIEATREMIAKWESQQTPDAIVMTVEFCHCLNCTHEWKQLRYGGLMVRYRNLKGTLHTYRPIETAEHRVDNLPKYVHIEGKETSYCPVCFLNEALVENLSEGYKERKIISGDLDQLDMFEVKNENIHSKGPRVSYPAREGQKSRDL